MTKPLTESTILREVVAKIRRSVAAPPKLTVDLWSDAHRVVSRSARPGPWSTDYTPYLRTPMIDYTDDSCEVIVLQFSAQVGKTAMIESMIAFSIHADPSPLFMVHPDDNSIADFSQEKLMPMIADTPVLKSLVKMPKPGATGSTERKKAFPGGYLGLVSANSPASLRGRSVRRIFFDEVDAYPASSRGEGDPVLLGKKRCASYPNRKIVITSTPTNEGTSRVEKAFLQGDQRRWYVPCKDCGVREPFQWKQVKWDKDKDGQPIAASAYYACEHCGAVHTDADKVAMNAQGMWVPTAKPKDPKVRSYHLNELASPWRTFEDIVRSFLEAKDDVELLRAWTNTTLGETWKVRGETVDWELLIQRTEPYPILRAPRGVRLIGAGVDVQHNRIAVSIIGLARGEESFLLHHEEMYADNGDVNNAPEMWAKLDELLQRPIPLDGGADLRIMACAIDSSDGHTQQTVYAFCRDKRGRGVIPIKGSTNPAAPALGTGRKQDIDWKGKAAAWSIELFSVGTHVLKATLYARLANKSAGTPGYVHFPTAGTDEEYFQQLCSEKMVTTYVKGVAKPEWVKLRKRNEALDTFVYAIASLHLVGLKGADWDKLDKLIAPAEYEAKKAEEKAAAAQPADPQAPAPAPAPQRKGPRVISSGWVSGFKNNY